jgi:predicted transcriptional regulator
MLAAKLALKYIDIEKKIRITAEDYLLDIRHLQLLQALWKKSPQTVSDLFRNKGHRTDQTYETLQFELEYLIGRRLVKQREIEAGETQYFAAQALPDVIQLIEEHLQNGNLSSSHRTEFANLLSRLKNQ